MKYNIIIQNLITGKIKELNWELNYKDDVEEEIRTYIYHMINYTKNDDGDDLFWINDFKDYDWMIM